MFCPNCKEEYRDEVSRCSECNVELVNRLLPPPPVEHEEPGEFVVVRTYPNEIIAAVAKTALDGSGIESTLRSDDCGGEDPGLSFARGIALVVSVADAAAAAEILNADTADWPVEDDSPAAGA